MHCYNILTVGQFSKLSHKHFTVIIINIRLVHNTQRVIISYQNDDDLVSKALALALTRAMLSLSDSGEDLGQAVRVAIRVASLLRHLLASSPQQPYASTVKGIRAQRKRLHFSSLVACFLF